MVVQWSLPLVCIKSNHYKQEFYKLYKFSFYQGYAASTEVVATDT
jgi:hypothetical protein